MQTMQCKDFDTLPTVVSIMTAARALGLSHTYAYELAKRGDVPCHIIRVGTTYRMPTAERWWARHDAPAGSSGRRRQPTVGPFKTKKAAQQALTEELAKFEIHGRQLDRSPKTGAYLETIWLPAKKESLSTSTFADHRTAAANTQGNKPGTASPASSKGKTSLPTSRAHQARKNGHLECDRDFAQDCDLGRSPWSVWRRIGDLNPGWACTQTALAVRRHRPD